ncbi:MAG: helix-turn-helix domain-containing protein [Candidatus Lernaella stagnicola]|nr:helix-turn-helix domain-containing protein [Candidatus Lernaella stagnicola]
MATMTMGEWSTLKEAADLLGVSPKTLQAQSKKGKIAAVKRGRDLWISADEIERYRREHLGTRRGGWLTSEEAAVALLPRIAAVGEFVDPAIQTTFSGGVFHFAVPWTPPEWLYGKRGRLDKTTAARDGERYRRAMKRKLRLALKAAKLDYVRTSAHVEFTPPDRSE